MPRFPMDFSNFELEITNRCNLECPRCARTNFIELLPNSWKKYDLNLNDFKKFIAPVLNKIEIFEFKGTMGDPIFHPKILDWIEWCKSNGKKVSIHTNGQAGASFWKRLSKLLDKNDCITIGIDGLPHNFMKYRINAKWKPIEECVENLKDRITLIWQFIVFSYNQNDIESARQLSHDMGFNKFDIIHSNRWESDDDWLMPSSAVNKRPIESFYIDPGCIKSPMHIVTADGYYMPCCDLIDYRFRYKTPWARTFDIRNNTIEDVIKSSISQDFFAKLTDEQAPSYCKFNCGKCNGK